MNKSAFAMGHAGSAFGVKLVLRPHRSLDAPGESVVDWRLVASLADGTERPLTAGQFLVPARRSTTFDAPGSRLIVDVIISFDVVVESPASAEGAAR